MVLCADMIIASEDAKFRYPPAPGLGISRHSFVGTALRAGTGQNVVVYGGRHRWDERHPDQYDLEVRAQRKTGGDCPKSGQADDLAPP